MIKMSELSFFRYKDKVSTYLDAFLPEDGTERDGLTRSMRYSLLAGGKRIRPLLALEFCAMLGGDVDKALPAACALEMVHNYSLIHDDLPCMDDDELRHGRPSNHVVFGECTATLAGDALQALAFSAVCESEIPAEDALRCVKILARAAGYDGMCRGQYLDMIGEGKVLTAEQLDDINRNKTGAMIAASCMIGAACAGADDAVVALAERFGYQVGLAFQIRDDILDVTATEAELGKPIGSDAGENKNTYMAIFGLEKCEAEVRRLTDEAVRILQDNFTHYEVIEDFARFMEKRTY